MATRLGFEHLRSVSFVVFDFDGVFTDNRVLVDQDGREAVFCSRADGLGLRELTRLGVGSMVLSTETNPVVSARAKKLCVECVQGVGDSKWATLRAIFAERGIDCDQVAFVGNDTNDIDAMKLVGHRVAPADAHPQIRAIATMVTDSSGGQGVVRELADLLVTK